MDATVRATTSEHIQIESVDGLSEAKLVRSHAELVKDLYSELGVYLLYSATLFQVFLDQGRMQMWLDADWGVPDGLAQKLDRLATVRQQLTLSAALAADSLETCRKQDWGLPQALDWVNKRKRRSAAPG